jgi:pimeloyl-ACP methyl ester carboxylesterase
VSDSSDPSNVLSDARYASQLDPPRTRRHFIDLREGQIHYAAAGEGRRVLLLHQTPRSWDEYRDVLPLLGLRYHAIAMDTPGFGDSVKPPLGADSIEKWARTVVDLMDALGLDSASIVGHHTGAAIATEVAASQPSRVDALVLSSAALRAQPPAKVRLKAPVDEVERKLDGSHLGELWQLRQAYYPDDAIDLLERFIIDALKAGPRASEGHHVVAGYDMASRLPLICCPVLLIAATEDPHAYPSIAALAELVQDARITEIVGGTVALPDHMPRAFGDAVSSFLAEVTV